jgi:hypothetical protein
MDFIFAETQGMQWAAASTANLAADTTSAGVQGQAAGLPVVPPGLDPVSAASATDIKTYTSHVASQLAAGAQLQSAYSQSISGSANAYILVDQLNATGLSAPGMNV